MSLRSTISESESPLELLKIVDRNITLWRQYNPTYHELRQNPKARTALQNDPGVKFMRHGWYILGAIVVIIYLIGVWG